MALAAVNNGAEARYTTVNQFYLALKGQDTDAYTLKNASNSTYALTLWNTGTGGALRVRNIADGANLLTVGESTTEVLNDFKATALIEVGGSVGVSPYQPKVKIVEAGSASTPLQHYSAYAPHTVYIMSADNPAKTAIWIESVDDTYDVGTGSQTNGSDGKRARVNSAIYVQHFANRDNGYDSSAVTIVEWGQANNISLTRTIYANADLGATTLRPDSIVDTNITWSKTAGYNIEAYSDGPTSTIDVQAREYGTGMIIGVGANSTTTGDNTGTREYSDGLRIYPYNGSAFISTGILTSDSGTATAGASTTLTDSGKAWTTNQWQFYVVRTTGGTGSGQERIVTSNTATALTVTRAWTTNPDATTTYTLDTYADVRSAIRVTAVPPAYSYYYNGFDTFRVMLDGKMTQTTARATSATPGAAPLYHRMLGRTNATDYMAEIQFGYQAFQAISANPPGAPAAELVFAAIGGKLASSAGSSSGGVDISTRRGTADANLTVAVAIQSSGIVTLNSGFEHKRGGFTLANGLNSNITYDGTATFGSITGPSAGFSVGGFTAPTTGCRELYLFNGTAQNMTIVNEDASSTAANRITTSTGADVVTTAAGTAHFIYDLAGTARWILVSSSL